MKILCIGNSFSQDSTALLQLLTDKITVRNLYIGGCSLDMHVANIENDAAKYELQENGEKMQNALVSIKEALISDKWDYITVQQVSGRSGVYDSFYPYLVELLDYVRKYSDAEIVSSYIALKMVIPKNYSTGLKVASNSADLYAERILTIPFKL